MGAAARPVAGAVAGMGIAAAQQGNPQNHQSGATALTKPRPVTAQKSSTTGPVSGFAYSGYAEAERWYRTLHPEIYPEGDFVELAPGDVVESNPYGIDINQFLRWAYSQLGYHEKASSGDDLEVKDGNIGYGDENYTKYGKWYDEYFKTSGFNGDEWCAAFASWCAHKAGITDDQIYKRAGTQLFIDWYSREGRFGEFSTADGAYEPKAGDIIFYQWNNKKNGHTGIVIGYKPAVGDDGTAYVYTIEGNHDERRGVCFRKVPYKKGSNISGFGVNGGSSNGFIPPEFR
jgi:hypothetical protein